jgi:hypothetical protein
MTFITGVELLDFNLLFDTKSRLLEFNLHIVAQIGSTLPIFRAGAAAEECFENSAADSASAKNFTENLEGIMKIAAAETGATLGKSSVPKAIVGSAFIRIHKDIVGFAELLEPFLGMGIIGIFVRMKFDREFAIRALDLFPGGVSIDTQNLVIIALRRGHFFEPRISRRRLGSGVQPRISPMNSQACSRS